MALLNLAEIEEEENYNEEIKRLNENKLELEWLQEENWNYDDELKSLDEEIDK